VADIAPSRALTLSAGSRLDYYSNFGSSLSPRAAVIVRPSIELTHRLSSALSATVATYANYVTNLIVVGGQGTAQSPNQYANSTSPIETIGAEFELPESSRPRRGLASSAP
jgi:outer membrane receptor for ferrienterochelin and colicin